MYALILTLSVEKSHRRRSSPEGSITGAALGESLSPPCAAVQFVEVEIAAHSSEMGRPR
jgi:hypothetical protein